MCVRARAVHDGRMRILKSSLVALCAVLPAVLAPSAVAAHYDPARVIIGEFQNCNAITACRTQVPPKRLDVMMYAGNLGGDNYWVRCLDSGGTIRFEYWSTHGGWVPVCVGVDV